MVSPAWLIVCEALVNCSKALLQTILDTNQLLTTTPVKSWTNSRGIEGGMELPSLRVDYPIRDKKCRDKARHSGI
jgi:hypothetical protein